MDTFRALVVDDDDATRKLASAAGDPARGLHVEVAHDLASGRELARVMHFHVAFVDLDLEGGSAPNTDGFTFLAELKEIRPSCTRVLITGYSRTEYRKHLFALLDPEVPMIDGAIDKADFKHLFTDYLETAGNRWLEKQVDIRNLDELERALRERRLRESTTKTGIAAQSSRDELDFVVSRLFGQGRGGAYGADDVVRIDLRVLDGGKSRSLVAVGRPECHNGDLGLPCVVKIGSRIDTKEEVERYNAHVRYRVGLHRRVEVLAHSVADTLGAVCYSFAGGEDASVPARDLQAMFDAGEPEALRHLETLFGPDSGWHGCAESRTDLARHFAGLYGLDPVRLDADFEAFYERAGHVLGFRKAGSVLMVGESEIPLIRPADLTAGRFRSAYAARIVHGDLNANNVILSATNEITLIDFRYTARGPAGVDVAAVNASARLAPSSWKGIADRVTEVRSQEAGLWGDGPVTDLGQVPYWLKVARWLDRHCAQSLPEVSRDELAATMLLYALRVFRARAVPDEAKLRLLIWASVLRDSLVR